MYICCDDFEYCFLNVSQSLAVSLQYAVCSFAVFVLVSGADGLTPQVAFVSLSLVNSLTRPLAMLPNMVGNGVQVWH